MRNVDQRGISVSQGIVGVHAYIPRFDELNEYIVSVNQINRNTGTTGGGVVTR